MYASVTPAQIAAFLRQTADGIDTAGDLGGFAGLRLFLCISAGSYPSDAPEHERVAVVHALATRLGLPNGDRQQTGSAWEYAARRSTGGLSVRVDADIDAPPQRCACGKTCTHDTTGTTHAA